MEREYITKIDCQFKLGLPEIVRCKDCKFLKPMELLAKQCCPLLNRAVRDDWFCANGERKDGDGE